MPSSNPPLIREATRPVRLETERLVLRELVETDWPAMRAWDSDPDVTRFQTNDVLDEQGTRDYLERSLASQRETPRRVYELGITLRETGQLIGRAGFKIDRPEHGDAMLWYVLRKDAWGRGYVPEAARALLRFAFEELGVNRMYADSDPRNTGSWRVMEKLGMRREAHHLRNWWIKGEWCDAYIYAVLADEWRAANPTDA